MLLPQGFSHPRVLAGFWEEVNVFRPDVQCTKVTKSNVTNLNPAGEICLERRDLAGKRLKPRVVPAATRGAFLGVRGGVDVGAHHAHLVVLLIEIMEQDIAQRHDSYQMSLVADG